MSRAEKAHRRTNRKVCHPRKNQKQSQKLGPPSTGNAIQSWDRRGWRGVPADSRRASPLRQPRAEIVLDVHLKVARQLRVDTPEHWRYAVEFPGVWRHDTAVHQLGNPFATVKYVPTGDANDVLKGVILLAKRHYLVEMKHGAKLPGGIAVVHHPDAHEAIRIAVGKRVQDAILENAEDD